jgi:phosphoribosylanthranilate isomerase
MIFWDRSPRNVTMIPTHAGIIPDRGNLPPAPSEGRGSELPQAAHGAPLRVGVFVDEMAQNIITRVVNFQLDLIQLHGHETPTLIRNLRRTLDPDIRPGIKFIKALSISSRDDVAAYKTYGDCVDYFLFDTKCPTVGGSGQQFDWGVLAAYDGEKPFLLSGGIGPTDAGRVSDFQHPKCIGIDLNSRFETEPGVKDITKLKQFLEQL